MNWIKKYGWMIWLQLSLVATGYNALAWQYWLIYVPTAVLVVASQLAATRESDLKRDLKDGSKREPYQVGQWAEDPPSSWDLDKIFKRDSVRKV